MGTTPAMYFYYFVLPGLHELRHKPGSVRLGFNAAVSAFHMSDVYYGYCERREPNRVARYLVMKDKRKRRDQFLRDLESREPAFRTVQAAATVYKHLYPTSPMFDGNSPQSFSGFTSPTHHLVGAWRESGGPFVSFKRRGHTETSLNDALDRVVDRMWPDVLGDLLPQ